MIRDRHATPPYTALTLNDKDETSPTHQCFKSKIELIQPDGTILTPATAELASGTYANPTITILYTEIPQVCYLIYQNVHECEVVVTNFFFFSTTNCKMKIKYYQNPPPPPVFMRKILGNYN